MLKRRIQDLTVCFTYNFSCFHPQQHGNKEFRQRYKLMEEIQRGGFGIVYKAYRTSDELPVAVKYVEHKHVRDWTMCESQLIPTEICHLELCRNITGVVDLIDWFASSKGFMIIMERPEHCMDLFDVLHMYGRLDEDVAKWVFVQVVDSVLQMKNDHDLIHRDIKDENVIVDMETGEVKLVDFGAADFLNNAAKKEFQGNPEFGYTISVSGTRSYCPPEWFKNKKYLPLEATVWSLGVLLYILVTGSIPFKNEIQTCLGRLNFPDFVTEDCARLIRRCLHVTPKRRCTLSELRQDAWMQFSSLSYAGTFHELMKKRALKKGVWKKRRNSVAGFEDDIDSSDDSELECTHRRVKKGELQRSGALVVPQEAIDRAKKLQDRASASPNLGREMAAAQTSVPTQKPTAEDKKSQPPQTGPAQAEAFHSAREENRRPLVEPRSNSIVVANSETKRRRPTLVEIREKARATRGTESQDSALDIFRSVSQDFHSLHSSSVSSRMRQPSVYESVASSHRLLDDCSSFSSGLYFSAQESDDDDGLALNSTDVTEADIRRLGFYEKSLRSLFLGNSLEDNLANDPALAKDSELPEDKPITRRSSISEDTDTELVEPPKDRIFPVYYPAKPPSPKRSIQSQKRVPRVQRILRRARSLKVPFRTDKKHKENDEQQAGLSAVKRLCSKSYDTVFAFSSALSGKADSFVKLRDQMQNHPTTSSPVLFKVAPDGSVTSDLNIADNSSYEGSVGRNSRRSPSLMRRLSSIRRRFGTKSKASNLQVETMKFPLAVFDVCSQKTDNDSLH